MAAGPGSRSFARSQSPPLVTGSVSSLDYELLDRRDRVLLTLVSSVVGTIPDTQVKVNFGTWPLLHQGLTLVITTVEGYN